MERAQEGVLGDVVGAVAADDPRGDPEHDGAVALDEQLEGREVSAQRPLHEDAVLGVVAQTRADTQRECPRAHRPQTRSSPGAGTGRTAKRFRRASHSGLALLKHGALPARHTGDAFHDEPDPAMTYALAQIAAPGHLAAAGAGPARPRMEHRLTFAHVRLEHAYVVRVSGDVDLDNAPRLQAALGRARALPRTLVLDLCEAGSFDEDGSLLLVNAVRRLVRSGRAVSIACPPGELRERLERRGLLRHVDVLDGRDELARAFGDPAVPSDRPEPMSIARRPRIAERTERPETPGGVAPCWPRRRSRSSAATARSGSAWPRSPVRSRPPSASCSACSPSSAARASATS